LNVKKLVIRMISVLGVVCLTGLSGCAGIDTVEVTHQMRKQTVMDNKEPLSNAMNAWWIKRKDNHEPSEAQDEIDLSVYDAYYYDQKPKGKVVYLTFDCGYENGYTETMLDVLKKHKATAAFFVTKHYVKESAHIVKRMKKEGHVVGNHTCNHHSLPSLSEEELKEEVLQLETYMKQYTGYEMDKAFRPPAGEYSEKTLQIIKNLGYRTYFWSMAYLDYDVNKQPGKEYVVEHFKQYHHNGAIPLIHNVSSSNAEALDEVLTNLEQEGYRFGTILEIGRKSTKKKSKETIEKEL
jgi:peptidoglycan-N-acetylmuramic acid deacetylase